MPENNITPHPTLTETWERIKITGSRPVVFWMTGLSGSGKSTIASLFEKKMNEARRSAFMLDGDTMRKGLCSGLGFTEADREENLRRIAETAKILADSGQAVVVCAISPTEKSRKNAREIIEKSAEFIEVYVKADVSICAARDPKGLYKKALSGEIKNFTGISAPYEIPENADIILDTEAFSAEECADKLVEKAKQAIYKPEKLIFDMIEGGIAASERIMDIYSGEFKIAIKDDASPITTADRASNDMLVSYFREKYPEYSILSEEEEDSRERLDNNAGVFIIDPLDGTKEFINRNGEFCVSIGFAASHRVIGGVIAVPAKRLIYYAFENMGAYKITFEDFGEGFRYGCGKRLHVSCRTGLTDNDKLIIVASRSHMDAETEKLIAENKDRIGEFLSVGSCLKGCMIAEGLADVHYRYGGFMKEWDTAAMQIICEEAGAIFAEHDGKPIRANREDPYNRNGFMILNRAESALTQKYKCPCCGYYTYNVPAKDDCGYICPVCFWENDSFIKSPDEPSDQNHGLSLKEAQNNFKNIGACRSELKDKARAPYLNELNGKD